MEAAAAGDHERHHDAVTGTQLCDLGTDLLDDAHELVAEHIAFLQHRHLAAVQMQVRTADRGGGDPQHDVVPGFDARIVDRVEADVLGAVVGECLHVVLQTGGATGIGIRTFHVRDRTCTHCAR